MLLACHAHPTLVAYQHTGPLGRLVQPRGVFSEGMSFAHLAAALDQR